MSSAGIRRRPMHIFVLRNEGVEPRPNCLGAAPEGRGFLVLKVLRRGRSSGRADAWPAGVAWLRTSCDRCGQEGPCTPFRQEDSMTTLTATVTLNAPFFQE